VLGTYLGGRKKSGKMTGKSSIDGKLRSCGKAAGTKKRISEEQTHCGSVSSGFRGKWINEGCGRKIKSDRRLGEEDL